MMIGLLMLQLVIIFAPIYWTLLEIKDALNKLLTKLEAKDERE